MVYLKVLLFRRQSQRFKNSVVFVIKQFLVLLLCQNNLVQYSIQQIWLFLWLQSYQLKVINVTWHTVSRHSKPSILWHFLPIQVHRWKFGLHLIRAHYTLVRLKLRLDVLKFFIWSGVAWKPRSYIFFWTVVNLVCKQTLIFLRI